MRVVYYVQPSAPGSYHKWEVVMPNQTRRGCVTKYDAVSAARHFGRTCRLVGVLAMVRVKNKRGSRIVDEFTYGKDPSRSPG